MLAVRTRQLTAEDFHLIRLAALSAAPEIAPAKPPQNDTCKFPCMPLKPCQRPVADAVSPRFTHDVAFTIRAWSRRTIVWACCQLSACQSTSLRETAPARGDPCCHLLCLLSRFAKVSRDARPAWEVSALSRGVCCACSTPIHPITGWPSLFPASHTRTPLGSPYGSLSLMGERRAYHVPHESHWMR